MTTHHHIELTEDAFDSHYPLVRNHLNPQASWAFDDEAGCLFETYGEELDFVRQQDLRHVWTLLDGDDDDQYLVSGVHFVNRIRYLVSTIAWPENASIQVRLDPVPASTLQPTTQE